jgi:GAF domain-containing protein
VAKLRDLLDGILDAGIEITGADFGNIQLRNQGTDELKLVAHRGFGSDFVKFFETVHRGDDCVCGAAFKNAKQVVVEDVSTDPIFRNTEAGKIVLSADARACQSTPICGRSGELFGMLNTHHRRPCRPSDNSLQMLDFLAQHAGDLIQKHEGNPRQPG